MSNPALRWPRGGAVALFLVLPCVALAGFSVDEGPRETAADPGDVFLPFLACDIDDGDGSCPPPSLPIPAPGAFDMDAWALLEQLQVCPEDPPFLPGILFSLDDGDPGPGPGVVGPDHAVEIFFFDHCMVLGAKQSYNTTITESVLGLGGDPPPTARDDDVDAFDTRNAAVFYQQGGDVLFSPDRPADGGLGAGSEAHIWRVNMFMAAPAIWADAALNLGVPDPELCDVDGIAPVNVPGTPFLVLFTTDLGAPCGLDPGDIYVSDGLGSHWLFADDVTDMQIAVNELQPVDVDALAVNDGGNFDVTDPYDAPESTAYKADWPNYAPSGLPDFSQDHAGFPPTWCGPSALADSLWWFDSEMECDRDRLTGVNTEIEPNDTPADADRLGESPPIAGSLAAAADVDWFVFDIPGKPHRTCSVTVSTCALRQPGDANTVVSLFDGGANNLLGTNDDGCPPATQSEVQALVPAGSRYYVKVENSPVGPGIGPGYTLTLGIDCYRMVERYREAPDDHSEYNPRPLISDLAWCMNTDDVQGTGSGHTGTRLPEMESCFAQYSTQKGLRSLYPGVVALMPPWDEVAHEIEKSEDVMLLLGFWWDMGGGQWVRCGGHYVTAAGADFELELLSISDPALNNAETGGAGRVRGPSHGDHAPAVLPPPDHDDTLNISHDQYQIGPTNVPWKAQFSLPTYATNNIPTSCVDVARWCLLGADWGQNPSEPPEPMEPCPGLGFRVSVEVEAMFDVSPLQTPICVFLDPTLAWPDNLRVDKGPCNPASDNVPKDLIRGKLCNLRYANFVPTVDLGFVQCLYDDSTLDRFDELSPDDTSCMDAWFYLLRRSGDPDYGNASLPGGQPRVPTLGGCP